MRASEAAQKAISAEKREVNNIFRIYFADGLTVFGTYDIILPKNAKKDENMKRDLLSSLVQWKNKPDRKPLILKGVRQCGKTYLLKEFGATMFADCVYFNFEENDSLQKVFENDFDTRRILFELSLFAGKTIQPGNTLLIFDEIQECGRAITSLKYFYENAPEYHIVCAGSLLGVALQHQLSFPVGKVEFLTLYPMSFAEYLDALGEEPAAGYLRNYQKGEALPQILADKLEVLLREYYFVGGMPAAVGEWCSTHDIEKVEKIQQDIINSYELDFAKHAPIQDYPKLLAIWRSIPEQLAKENAKFIFSHVKAGWRGKDLENALEWLLGAGLACKVCRIEKPFFPLSSYADDTAFKLYLSDVGLLHRLSKLPPEIILNATPQYAEFKGAMTENYVLTELLKSGIEAAYYWTSGNEAEVDFVIQCGGHIVPIEVKSEKNVKARSLAEYRKKYAPEYAVKTSMKSEFSGEEVRNIPLYRIASLKKMI